MQRKTSVSGFLLLLLTAVIWGFAFVAQRVGADHVGAFLFNGIRFALGSLSLLPVILLFEKPEADRAAHLARRKTTVRAGLLCGVFLFSASTCQQYGMELLAKAGAADASGRTGFLTALYMVIVPLIGLFFRKRPAPGTWCGIFCAVLGLFCITFSGGGFSGNGGTSLAAGDAMVLLCAVLFAVHILIIDRFGERVYSLRFSMLQFAVCAVLSLAGAGIRALTGGGETSTLADLRAALIPLLYGGFLSVGVAYTCQVLGQKRADPAVASVILSMESMFSVLGGALILHEKMPPVGYLGCALIFAGVVLTQLPVRHPAGR